MSGKGGLDNVSDFCRNHIWFTKLPKEYECIILEKKGDGHLDHIVGPQVDLFCL